MRAHEAVLAADVHVARRGGDVEHAAAAGADGEHLRVEARRRFTATPARDDLRRRPRALSRRKMFSFASLGVALASLLLSPSLALASALAQPNFVLHFIDDTGFGD